MKKLTTSLTAFFVLGILSIVVGLVISIVLINGVSAADGIMGFYILLGLIPVVLLIIIDRICVRKFGAKKVNIIQLYILGIFILLFIINWFRLQLQR